MFQVGVELSTPVTQFAIWAVLPLLTILFSSCRLRLLLLQVCAVAHKRRS